MAKPTKSDLSADQAEAARAVWSMDVFGADNVSEALRGSDLSDRKVASAAKKLIAQWEEDGVIVSAGEGKWKKR